MSDVPGSRRVEPPLPQSDSILPPESVKTERGVRSIPGAHGMSLVALPWCPGTSDDRRGRPEHNARTYWKTHAVESCMELRTDLPEAAAAQALVLAARAALSTA